MAEAQIGRTGSVWESTPAWVLSRSGVSGSLATRWTVAHQAPLSRGFPRRDSWGRRLFPAPGDLTEPWSPALAGRFFAV